MGRTKLKLPARFHFETEIPIQVNHINYGGHLGNDSALTIIHEARLRFLKHFGYSETNIEGAGIIMVDAVVVYKSEGFHGEVLSVGVAVGDFSRHSCDFYYRLAHRETGREVARAKTTVYFFDYKQRKKVRTPEAFRARFAF